MKKEQLRLEMNKRNDAVRTYLGENGLRMKSARAVKNALQNYARYDSQNGFLMAKFGSIEKPTALNKKWMTADERELEKHARTAGWKEPQDLLRVLQIFKESDHGQSRVKAYLVPKLVLDHLVAYKKRKKHLGGLKSLDTAAAKKPSKTS